MEDPGRENVTVGIDYVDLRSGPCDSSMVVEPVPDELGKLRCMIV
jgi:hypothetical protein